MIRRPLLLLKCVQEKTATLHCLIKCAHLTNLHTFHRDKIYGWIRVTDRVTVWVGARIRVRVSVTVSPG